MHFQITAVRLDSNTIFADVHSIGYDAVMRYDREAFEGWMTIEQGWILRWNLYWDETKHISDKNAKSDLTDYIKYNPYLLSQLRDAIRLKEIEAIIYKCDMLRIINCSELNLNEKECDHLHSLITQYGDGRVETEGLKYK